MASPGRWETCSPPIFWKSPAQHSTTVGVEASPKQLAPAASAGLEAEQPGKDVSFRIQPCSPHNDHTLRVASPQLPEEVMTPEALCFCAILPFLQRTKHNPLIPVTELFHQVQVLATKPGDLNLIPEANMVEGKKITHAGCPGRPSPTPHTHTHTRAIAQTYPHELNAWSIKRKKLNLSQKKKKKKPARKHNR